MLTRDAKPEERGRHILIGVLYNQNGIATWCIESARALILHGFKVSLISTMDKWVPDDLKAYKIILPQTKRRGILQKIRGRINWWLNFFIIPKSNYFPVQYAFGELVKLNLKPDLVLVAQTDFIWKDSPIPQWVVARSWPVDWPGYWTKMKTIKGQRWLTRLHDLWFWYRMDHLAYQQAHGVIAITKELKEDLITFNRQVKLIYPPIQISGRLSKSINRIPHLVSVAQDLGDPLKQIDWMVARLAALKRKGFKFYLTLVGGADSRQQDYLKKLIPNIDFTGRVSNAKLLEILRSTDLYIVGSLKENFGYAVVEAISQGNVVVAPNIYPFNEYIVEKDCLYERSDFEMTIQNKIMNRALNEQQARQLAFIENNMSYRTFSKKIAEVLN